MDRDLRHAADGGDALLGAAKVERASDAEAAQHLDIGFGEMAEMVGAEDLPPADARPPLAGYPPRSRKLLAPARLKWRGGVSDMQAVQAIPYAGEMTEGHIA